MEKLLESTLFWIVVAILFAIALVAINFLMRKVADQQTGDPSRYPHRVANQLPRELHTSDRDEVLDLEDPTGPSTK
ncbi:hypothetical protein KIH39_06165 [Telmatocola sphagniphila]|uniref:Uncharacterized protein n=1 Tax=Telmatocola sphagniphila TaxID=1123043 RepID=A0A8E6B7V1_9BACT|nr:hypothetical protein [Telmatocola sphagniphila]QVL33493.1 hypothetical protein KIH39_06165 [Telmatocola sphagniphila]